MNTLSFFAKPLARLLALQLVAALLPAIAGAAEEGETQAALQPYVPLAVPPPPKDATYLMKDGSIFVCGNDLMVPLFEKLNALFIKTHPGFKFHTVLLTSSLALSGLTAGKSAFGPTAREADLQELGAFSSRYGYPASTIQIGWDNNPSPDVFPGGKTPPCVWVNVNNPVPVLTMDQLRRILTTGSPEGDITHWGQIVGDEQPTGQNGGQWAWRRIHVYLPNMRKMPIYSTTRIGRLGGYPWTPAAEYMPFPEDPVDAVANDRFGIALTGNFPQDLGWENKAVNEKKLRLMPLEGKSGVWHEGLGNLSPLSAGLRFYINRVPGKPIDPWLKEYIRLALSKEGQEMVAAMTQSDGFIPLDPAAVAEELAKLE